MSFLSIFDAVNPVVNKILNFIPDPQQRLEAQQQLLQTLSQWDTQQSQVNAAEATSSSVFVAGWRPWIGWGCGMAIWYQYLVIPLATWGFAAAHVIVPEFPKLDDNMWQLTFGMLGMGGLRSFDKLKGTTK